MVSIRTSVASVSGRSTRITWRVSNCALSTLESAPLPYVYSAAACCCCCGLHTLLENHALLKTHAKSLRLLKPSCHGSLQMYQITSQFMSKEWIMEKWDAGFYITAAAGALAHPRSLLVAPCSCVDPRRRCLAPELSNFASYILHGSDARSCMCRRGWRQVAGGDVQGHQVHAAVVQGVCQPLSKLPTHHIFCS